MSNPSFIIERMTLADLNIAVQWAKENNWNPGLYDAKCFYATDPTGFFIGKLNGEPIVTGLAVIYDERFAFCGFYMIAPPYRHQGYGMQLTKARLNYVGSRITGIDGVLTMLDKYANIGYVLAYQNIRYTTAASQSFDFPLAREIVHLNHLPFQQLAAYDRCYFPAARPAFLKCWIQQPECAALGYMKNGELQGYGVARRCSVGFKIGPLFAESYDIANQLFQALTTTIKTGPFFLDIPKPNLNAQKLVNHYGMQEIFAVGRMYRNGKPELNLENIYGNTTFELG